MLVKATIYKIIADIFVQCFRWWFMARLRKYFLTFQKDFANFGATLIVAHVTKLLLNSDSTNMQLDSTQILPAKLEEEDTTTTMTSTSPKFPNRVIPFKSTTTDFGLSFVKGQRPIIKWSDTFIWLNLRQKSILLWKNNNPIFHKNVWKTS